jgi:phage terminase large subunit-like protein
VWQADLVQRAFGWRRADGTRRFRTVYLEVPKKNGKSTLAAAVVLYLLIADGEAGGEVYGAAVDRAQASIVYDQVVSMVKQSPALSRRLVITDYHKRINYPRTNSLYRVLSADVAAHEGLNASGVVIDELHAHPSRKLYDTLRYSGAARRQPMSWIITTAGVRDETGIGWSMHDHARKVLDGLEPDDALLPVMYAADPDEDWTEPATWARANPNYGVSVQASDFSDAVQAARHQPAEESAFRRYRLNQWVSATNRAVDLGEWDRNHAHAVDDEDLAGRPVFGGLDLASVADLTALVWVSPCPVLEGAVDLVCRFWLPEGALEKGPTAPLYRTWVDQGLLRTTPGDATDYDFIVAAVIEDAARFNVQSLGIDRLWQGQWAAGRLLDAGLPVVTVGQGFLSMAAPMREFLRLLAAGALHHGGHPVLRWMADALEVRPDPAGNFKPDRTASRQKIDGIVATLMGLDGWSRARGAASVLETEGLRVW